MTNQKPSLINDADPNSISIEAATQIIFSGLPILSQTESVPVANALGRVLAVTVNSPLNVPSFRASAMDGYAYRHAEGNSELTISEQSLAGHPSGDQEEQNRCHRITTGARVPDFADTVVQQENVTVVADKIVINQHPEPGLHVRPAGSDSQQGTELMPAGQRLAAAQIACLYSHGLVEIEVLRALQVAIFSTGDELVEPGNELPDGHIYDANRALLESLLNCPSVLVTDIGIVKDSVEALQKAFDRCKEFDLVISSGGVSVGDADFVRPVLEEKGDLHMWKVAMKPGRPLTFGLLNNAQPYFGLPGNPVSAAITCMMFVIPAVQTLLKQQPKQLPRIKAKVSANLKKLPGRVEYQRGILNQNELGEWSVSTTGLQDSHVVTSLHRANCLVELSFDSTGAKTGELVPVIPFEHFSESIL